MNLKNILLMLGEMVKRWMKSTLRQLGEILLIIFHSMMTPEYHSVLKKVILTIMATRLSRSQIIHKLLLMAAKKVMKGYKGPKANQLIK